MCPTVNLVIIGFDNGLVPIVVNKKHRNKFQWNLNQKIYRFIEENALEHVAYVMSWQDFHMHFLELKYITFD